HSTRVLAEQSASRGLPMPAASVWQRKGAWCGPEITGPLIGWSVSSSVAVRVPVGPVTVAVTWLTPTRNPSTTPSRVPAPAGAKSPLTSVPSLSTRTMSPACTPRTSIRADSPVTVAGRLETTATSICPSASGGVPPNHDAGTVTPCETGEFAWAGRAAPSSATIATGRPSLRIPRNSVPPAPFPVLKCRNADVGRPGGGPRAPAGGARRRRDAGDDRATAHDRPAGDPRGGGARPHHRPGRRQLAGQAVAVERRRQGA